MDMRGKPACYGRFDGGRMQHALGRSSPPVCSTRPSINYRSLGTMGSWHNVGGSMAAWLESPDPLVVDLRKVTAADLAPLLEEERAAERENALIEATLEALWRSPGVHRVEAQLLMLGSPLARKVPFASWFRSYPRRFLEAPAAHAL